MFKKYTGYSMNTTENEQTVSNLESQTRFKEKMHNQGKFEIRGAYLEKNLHKDLKKIVKLFKKHQIRIMLFINTLED